MKNQKKGHFKYSGFTDLLSDAGFHLRLAKISMDKFVENKHSRASLLASVFALEYCANSLVEVMGLSKHLKNDIERSTTLNKFEYFQTLRAVGKGIDRGCAKVQTIKELIDARNNLVHSRSIKCEANFEGFKSTERGVEVPWEFIPDFFSFTKLAKNPAMWNADNAELAIRCVCAFLGYYFRDIVTVTDGELNEMFGNKFFDDAGKISVEMNFELTEIENELKLLLEMGCDLSFLPWVKL